jgi:hypothetical protein
VKYRWVDAERPVRYCGPASSLRGAIGSVEVLPRPGCLGNVLVDFSGRLVVVPAGCLRTVRPKG